MKRITIILVLCLASTAVAQAPRTMNFQGTLADGLGTTLPDGNYNLTFRLWNADVGGAILWTEARTVTVGAGIFTIVLGEVTPLALPFDQPYWLGIQVGGDTELSPRSPLTAMPYALNVADGAVVQSLNGRVDDVNIVGGANITVNTVGNNIIINGTGALTDGDWNVNGFNMTSIPTGFVGIGINPPEQKLEVRGNVRAGDSDLAGSFLARVGNGYNASTFGGAHGGQGAVIDLVSETGITNFTVQPDIDGTGGYLSVRRSEFGEGFAVDGNYNGTESTRMTIYGASPSYFRTDQTGDAAVVLPGNAINRAEIVDEPGIASVKAFATAAHNLTTSNATVASRTIVVPSDGHVVVIANAEVDINHSTGSSGFCTMGIADTATGLPNNQDISFYLPAGAASGVYLTSHHTSAVFAVTAGSHTFYLNGSKNSASVDAQVWDVQLTAMYFPTAYGTVSTTDSGAKQLSVEQDNDAPGVAGPSAADLAAEQAESEAFARDRVERELAAMREQIDRLQSEVERLNEVDGSR